MKILAIGILALLLYAAGGALAEGEDQHPTLADETYRAYIGQDGAQHVAITGGNYFFRPNHVIVQVNVPVDLGVSQERGLIPHSFVIHAPEAGIDVDQNLSNNIQHIRFTPTHTGTYAFYCKNKLLFLPSHRMRGMEGTLEVTP